MVDGVGCRFTVSLNQSAGPQQGTSEIADHHQQDIGEVMADQLPQYGFSGSGGGLSVIAGTEPDVLLSQPPGITMMPGIVMFLFDFQQYLSDLLLSGHRIKAGDKAASLLLEESFGRRFNGGIGVLGHPGYILSFFSISST